MFDYWAPDTSDESLTVIAAGQRSQGIPFPARPGGGRRSLCGAAVRWVRALRGTPTGPSVAPATASTPPPSASHPPANYRQVMCRTTHRVDVSVHNLHGLMGNRSPPWPRGAVPSGCCGPRRARRTPRPSSTCWGGSCSRAAAAAENFGWNLEADSRSPAEDSVRVHSYFAPEFFLCFDSEVYLK
ncbi:hypothetical protein EYF80_046771 [Liparis tanakae]|uniref:Uncharacterized protein n=1 Tax=Liparis tanakae TaxID=230148 RepID=A0A4Z2FRM3_9TELE|nr:hypothetical protein EYF80_046771 [Liparis tanakae]